MKKTCGALVIGLMITTNVYAKEEWTAYCGKNPDNKVSMLINYLKVLTLR